MRYRDAAMLAFELNRRPERLCVTQGWHALQILALATGAGTSVRALRDGPFRGLLELPAVKPILARAGGGTVSGDDFAQAGGGPAVVYDRRFTVWGPRHPRNGCQRAFQTSRPGASLVLLLAFSPSHARRFHHLVPAPIREQAAGAHFAADDPRRPPPAAWCRLDWQGDEALIEEVQTDWLRPQNWEASLRLVTARAPGFRDSWHELRRDYGVTATNASGLARYWRCREAHRASWAPTAVVAALRFLFRERGIARVFFHDHDTKCRLLGLERFGPPRSLYTDVPRRLGFTRTAEYPAFLARELAQLPGATFWVMHHPAPAEARVETGEVARLAG